MLNEVKKLSRVLFLDVETVPQKPSYKDLDENWQELWTRKMRGAIEREEVEPGDIYDRAGIYAEFGKIVCISAGVFENEEATSFRMKSFYGDDEVKILSDFSEMLNSSSVNSLCAHNGKEFDFPYIARRCLINGLSIPELLDNAGKKPWEVSNFDTMELWKFGDYKSFTSLNLLAASFGIRSPKDDIDGSDVWRVYWEENDVKRIMIYCQKDVETVARLFLKFMYPGKNFDFNIKYVEH